MTQPTCSHRPAEEIRTLEDRLALLSLLQELTVAVLDVFDPEKPADRFLEKVAASLGCPVALCVEASPEGRVELVGSFGLARTSRSAVPPPASPGCAEVELPYREVAAPGLVRWSFRIEDERRPPAARWLLLWFEREPLHPLQHRGMLRRVAQHLHVALEHRARYARVPLVGERPRTRSA